MGCFQRKGVVEGRWMLAVLMKKAYTQKQMMTLKTFLIDYRAKRESSMLCLIRLTMTASDDLVGFLHPASPRLFVSM
jgi:hypothetical protein